LGRRFSSVWSFLRSLRDYPDPVERALHLEPIDDEGYTDAEREAAKEATGEWMRGEVRSLDDVRRELGLYPSGEAYR
jgi:hypothetical protein